MKERERKIRWTSFLLGSFLLALSGMPLYGQDMTAGEHRLDRNFIRQMGTDFQCVVSSPGRWQKKDFLRLATISGATFLLFVLDQDIRSEVVEHRTAFAQDSATFFSTFGDGAILLGGLAALYGAGEIGREDSLRRTALLSLESLVTTTFFIWTAKFFFGRSRPSTGESSTSFHPFSFSSGRTSFPSGHAASAFAVATTVAEQTDDKVLDIVAYSLASFVGVARSIQDKHWASDVFFGSAVGYFVAKKICRLNRAQKKVQPQVSFGLSTRQKTLTVSFSF